jgi:uncharacterized protein YegL
MQNMNSNKKTEVFILLDKSGSMGSTWNTTVEGIKVFIDELKTTEGEVFISLATFSDECTLNVEHVNLNNFDHNTVLEIKVAGMTALNDSIFNCLSKFEAILEKQLFPINNNVIFMIITDGHENASQTYTTVQVQKEISKRKKLMNWKFMFIGANIDAIKTADVYGICPESAIQYSQNTKGIRNVFSAASDSINHVRKGTRTNLTFTPLQRHTSNTEGTKNIRLP